MRTPKEYTDNLQKKIITENMLLDCLYSVNKRAKNYRDKEREYRQYYRRNRYAYDEYGNIDRCQEMKEQKYIEENGLCSICRTSYKDCERMSSNYTASPKGSVFRGNLVIKCPKFS